MHECVDQQPVRPVPRKVYTEKKPGIQPGGDSSGYINSEIALVDATIREGDFEGNEKEIVFLVLPYSKLLNCLRGE